MNALISVFNKQGLHRVGLVLTELGFKLYGSRGSATEFMKHGITCTDVAVLIGTAPLFGHRVATLSWQLHGGILARDVDLPELEQMGLPKFDLVYVGLYPLEEEVGREGSTRESVIEKTDIGGPALLRSAAKARKLVASNPEDLFHIIQWWNAGKPDEDRFITLLVAKAELVCARYSLVSGGYHLGSPGLTSQTCTLIDTMIKRCDEGIGVVAEHA